jgi:glycerol-3-phosphate dehydrogenase
MAVKNFKMKKTTFKKVLNKLSKSKSSYKKTKKSMSGGSNCNFTRKLKFNKNKSKYKSKSKSKSKFKSKSKKHLKQKGGFLNDDNCNLATIREPGFHLEGSGNIEGISIPESRAVIYNPNCKIDTDHPMTS